MSRLDRVLEIAASTRVLRERRRTAIDAARGSVVLGRHFLTLRGVAEACAAETGVAVRQTLDDAAFARLVAGCAAGGRLGTLLGQRPGLAPRLAAALRDLYDAGIEPQALPDAERELRRVYVAVLKALEQLRAQGVFERVGLFQLAGGGARDWIGRLGITRIELHGATELVGSAGDLVQALHDCVPVRMFQTDWASAWGDQLRATWPWSFTPEPTEVLDAPALPRDGEIPDGALRALAASGPRQEIDFVTREILRLLASGVDASRICVVARSLEPHAPWIEASFARHGLPFTSSLGEPALRHPAARVWLDLIDATFGDLERAPTLRLLRSPRVADSRRLAPFAEWLAGRTGLLGGRADWKAALDQAEMLSKEDRRSLDGGTQRALDRVVRRLDGLARSIVGARDFASCAASVLEAGDALLETCADPDAREADQALRDALERLGNLDQADAAAGAARGPTRSELHAALRAAVAAPRRRPFEDDDGGVRVLDALQARAVPCDHLFLIGLQHGVWPREHGDDPFVPGALREILREQTGRPVPVPSLADAEERFLFGLLLSQARERVTLTWATADAAGRELPPSSFLRSLPFVAPYSSVLERAAPEARPEELLGSCEALIHTARVVEPDTARDTLPALAADFAEPLVDGLRAGLAQVATTERLEVTDPTADLAYDGVLDPASLRLPDAFSPSQIEGLGGCPLRALFSKLLRVPELDELPAGALDSRESGRFVHAVLARLYAALFEAGALRSGTPVEHALERARALLPAAIEDAATEQRLRLRERRPHLWAAIAAQLRIAALDFVARDLETLLPEGVTELLTEQRLDFSVETAGGPLSMAGTPDRLLVLGSGQVRMGDYKTRADPSHFVGKTRVARGLALQLPLYVLASAERHPGQPVQGEALAVPLRPERDRRRTRERPRGIALEKVQELTGPPLDALGELLREAHFPFRESDDCRHCPYTVACRHAHAPSEQRVSGADAFEDYFALHPESA